MDPKSEDAQCDYVTILRRAQEAIERELFTWTSAPVQEASPSGTTVNAPPPPPSESGA